MYLPSFGAKMYTTTYVRILSACAKFRDNHGNGPSVNKDFIQCRL